MTYTNGSTVDGDDIANTFGAEYANGVITNTWAPVSLEVIKVAKGTTTGLPNAEFQMTRKNGSGAYELFENPKFSVDAETSKRTGPFSVGSTGEITIEGLIPGDYKLKATAAPKGYIIATGDIDFTINTDGTVSVSGRTADGNGNITYSDTNNMVTFLQKTENSIAKVTVENTPGTALPQTGGIGTTLFTALGGLMTVTAGAILTLRRTATRRRGEKQAS